MSARPFLLSLQHPSCVTRTKNPKMAKQSASQSGDELRSAAPREKSRSLLGTHASDAPKVLSRISATIARMSNHKLCSICERPGAAEIVNRLLGKGTFLKVIAQQTGFSKSSVHRHSQKCVIRQQAAQLKTTRFDPQRQRIIVKWPDGSLTHRHSDKWDDREAVLLVVSYEDSPFYNPAALMENGTWSATAQNSFITKVPPPVIEKFIQDQYAEALLENAARENPEVSSEFHATPDSPTNGSNGNKPLD